MDAYLAEANALDATTMQAAHGNAAWFLAGFCLNGVGVIIAFIAKPDSPSSTLLGKSTDYVVGYAEAYGDKARNKNVVYALEGCCASVLASALSYGLYNLATTGRVFGLR